MTAARWNLLLGLAIVAGALAWLVKFVVIWATEGRETVSGTSALLWDFGLFLLAGGAIGIALRLTRRNLLIIRIAASLLAPPLFFLLFLAIDFLVRSVIPNGWPSYVRDEAGIAVTAAVWFVLGLMVMASHRRVGESG